MYNLNLKLIQFKKNYKNLIKYYKNVNHNYKVKLNNL